MNKRINYDSYAGRGRPRKSDYIPARASANDRNYEAELINSSRHIKEKSDWWDVLIIIFAVSFISYLLAHAIVYANGLVMTA